MVRKRTRKAGSSKYDTTISRLNGQIEFLKVKLDEDISYQKDVTEHHVSLLLERMNEMETNHSKRIDDLTKQIDKMTPKKSTSRTSNIDKPMNQTALDMYQG